MTASVDSELFTSIEDAIRFVAACGGGVVRVQGPINLVTEWWKSYLDFADRLGVKLEVMPAVPTSQQASPA